MPSMHIFCLSVSIVFYFSLLSFSPTSFISYPYSLYYWLCSQWNILILHLLMLMYSLCKSFIIISKFLTPRWILSAYV